MHPPLLKSIAGRHKNRMKSATEGGSSSKGTGKRRHKCPICKELGHHWYKCNNGNPEDIVAMELERVHQRNSSRRKQLLVPQRVALLWPLLHQEWFGHIMRQWLMLYTRKGRENHLLHHH